MKLALIRRRFTATGGAELYLQRLLAALLEAGHELHLFAEDWEGMPTGVTVHRQMVSGSRAQRPRLFAEAVREQIAHQSFDCVFSLERTLHQDVYRAGDGVHRMWLQRRRQFAPWWRKPFVGFGAFHRTMSELEAQTLDPRNTRHVIVNSEMVREEILDRFAFPAERIHLVRNGVDVARFQRGQRTETRARFGIGEHDFLLLFVGSGWERKGLRFILRALRKLQPHGMLEFTSGLRQGMREFQKAARRISDDIYTALSGVRRANVITTSEEFEPPAERLKLLVIGKDRKPRPTPPNVIFAGPMVDVENAYAAADLFIFLPIYEPSANVVFEALAAGVPVITSIQNGAAEMIDENVNGKVLENPSDTDAVIEAIRFWWLRRFQAPPIKAAALSLERNVSETAAVLELAARERLDRQLLH